jgi:ABC-type oligopeptide transport system substrate-binding subunit
MRKKLLISMAATTILLGTTCVALSACGESSASVTFRNWDESELYTVECKNGDETNYPDTSVPVRADDAQYTYTFIGWRDSKGNIYETLPAVSIKKR